MSKVLILIAVFLTSLIAGYFVFFNTSGSNMNTPSGQEQNQVIQPSLSPGEVEIEASFAIFTNGTLRVFTENKYHNRSQDVFISSENPNIIQVKKPGTTWGYFFSTLPMTLSSECLTTGTQQTFCTGSSGTLQFYINGEQNDAALDQEIKDGDQLLVSFGSESMEIIKSQLEQIPIP